MTLVLKLDLDMVKMSYHTKNEDSMSRHSKVIACADTDRQTDIQTVWKHYLPSYVGGKNVGSCSLLQVTFTTYNTCALVKNYG